MWQNPVALLVARGMDASSLDEKKTQEDFEDFYEEVFEEMAKFGRLEDLHVVDNLGDHLVGNVYAKYHDEEDAQKCKDSLNGRYYAGRPLTAQYCPVTDFREGR